MRKAVAKKLDSKLPPKPEGAQVRGKVVMAPLSAVKPNDYNPNTMSPFEKQALKHGFKKDGWLASHALTIWRTDEKGTTQNIIIDGEHRWYAAKELGIVNGPMVFLDGIPLNEAIALTIKLDQKRGHFDDQKLGVALRRIGEDFDLETRALDLGIPEQDLGEYFASDVGESNGVIGGLPSGQTSAVKTVQLFFQPGDHEEFDRLTKDLAIRGLGKNTTDVVVEAVRRAHAATAKK